MVKNKTGPRWEPWGSPIEMVCWDEKHEPTRTAIVLSVRKLDSQDTLLGRTPDLLNLLFTKLRKLVDDAYRWKVYLQYLIFCSRILLWFFKVLLKILAVFSTLKDHNLAPELKFKKM